MPQNQTCDNTGGHRKSHVPLRRTVDAKTPQTFKTSRKTAQRTVRRHPLQKPGRLVGWFYYRSLSLSLSLSRRVDNNRPHLRQPESTAALVLLPSLASAFPGRYHRHALEAALRTKHCPCVVVVVVIIIVAVVVEESARATAETPIVGNHKAPSD